MDRSRSSTCHLHATSSPVRRVLLPSARAVHPVLSDGLWATEVSNRLPSNKPMYVVLARSATKTIVCMGCVKARREMDWRTGVICRFNQPGFEAASLIPVDRQRRVGKKDAAPLMVEVSKRVKALRPCGALAVYAQWYQLKARNTRMTG